jgi:hypothetical protein
MPTVESLRKSHSISDVVPLKFRQDKRTSFAYGQARRARFPNTPIRLATSLD